MAATSAAQITDRSHAHRLPAGCVSPSEDRSPGVWRLSPATTFLDHLATLLTYCCGERVCGPGKTQASLYRVVAGVVKTFTLLPGGRQHTIDLLFSGDFFVLDTQHRDGLVAEALNRVTVMAEYRHHEVERLAASRPDVRAFLTDVAFGNDRRLQRHVLTMSNLRTTQKVGALLLELLERLPEQNGEAVTLPVSRYDIADYLGLAMGSVSRSLRKLKSEGAIWMTAPRRVMITDRAA